MHLKEEFVSHTFASGIRVLQHAVVLPYKSTAVKLIFYYFFSPASFSSKKNKGGGARKNWRTTEDEKWEEGMEKEEVENMVSSTGPHIIESQKVFAKSDPFDIT